MTVQIVQMKVSNPERSGQRTTSGISLGSKMALHMALMVALHLAPMISLHLYVGSDGAVMLR